MITFSENDTQLLLHHVNSLAYIVQLLSAFTG